MKINYKNCEIECCRENECLFYSIFDKDEFEVDSGFSCCEDTVRDYIESLKKTVDDYIEHPEYYKDEIEDEDLDNVEDDDNVKYQITPKGIAALSLMRCGLVSGLDDPRIEGFWTLFEDGMKKSGYIVEEDENDISNIPSREKELREKITEECSRKDDVNSQWSHNYHISQNNNRYDFRGCPDDLECAEGYAFSALCDEVSNFDCKKYCKKCWENFLRGGKC